MAIAVPPTSKSVTYTQSPYAPVLKERIELDPDDPFEDALIAMVEINRRKRRDYAVDSDPMSNFRTTAEMLGLKGFGALEAAQFNVLQKWARLKALRQNGRMDDTSNESTADSILDAAVYSVICLALQREREVEDDL